MCASSSRAVDNFGLCAGDVASLSVRKVVHDAEPSLLDPAKTVEVGESSMPVSEPSAMIPATTRDGRTSLTDFSDICQVSSEESRAIRCTALEPMLSSSH